MSDIKFGIVLPYFSSEKITDFITSLLNQDYKDFYVLIIGTAFNDEMLSIFEGLDSRFAKLDFLESNLDSSDLDSMFNLYAKAQNAGIDFFKLGLESSPSNTAGGGGKT